MFVEFSILPFPEISTGLFLAGGILKWLFGRKKHVPYGQKESRQDLLNYGRQYGMSPEAMGRFIGPDLNTHLSGVRQAREQAARPSSTSFFELPAGMQEPMKLGGSIPGIAGGVGLGRVFQAKNKGFGSYDPGSQMPTPDPQYDTLYDSYDYITNPEKHNDWSGWKAGNSLFDATQRASQLYNDNLSRETFGEAGLGGDFGRSAATLGAAGILSGSAMNNLAERMNQNFYRDSKMFSNDMNQRGMDLYSRGLDRTLAGNSTAFMTQVNDRRAHQSQLGNFATMPLRTHMQLAGNNTGYLEPSRFEKVSDTIRGIRNFGK